MDPAEAARVVRALETFATSGLGDVKALKGPLKGQYRLRVSKWRVFSCWTVPIPLLLSTLTTAGRHTDRRSGNTLALGCLTGQQKSFNQLAFPADRHARESFVPQTLENFGLSVQPLRQKFQLGRRDLAALHAVEQMVENSGGNVLAADSRHVQMP